MQVATTVCSGFRVAANVAKSVLSYRHVLDKLKEHEDAVAVIIEERLAQLKEGEELRAGMVRGNENRVLVLAQMTPPVLTDRSALQGFARRAPFTNARIGRVGLSGRGPPRPMPTQVRSMRATMQQSRSARAALGGSAAVARHSPPRGRPQAGLDAATIKSDVRNTFFPICLLTSCIRPPALTWSIRVHSCRRACGARGSTSPSRRRCRRSSC